MKLPWLVLAALPMITLALGQPAAAHEGFASEGRAWEGTSVVTILISRELDIPGLFYRIILTDVVTGDELLHVRFTGADNYVSDENFKGPTYVNTEFWAESTDPNYHFHMHGVQIDATVTGTGEFQASEFYVSVPLI